MARRVPLQDGIHPGNQGRDPKELAEIKAHCPVEMVKALDIEAKRLRCTRAQLIRRYIRDGLPVE